MKFCPDCGNPHECAAETVSNVEAEETKRVRIQAERDMEIARINAGAAKAIAATEADSEADHLEGVIEGAELMAGDGGDPPPAEPGGEPIVVQVDATDDDAPDIEEPPVVEPAEPATPARAGYWDNYR